MNKLRDTDLREALRRREAKRPQTEVPDDFLDRVMQEVGTIDRMMQDAEPEGQDPQRRTLRRTRHIVLTALAAAASIALVVLLAWPRQTKQDFTGSKVRGSSEESPTFLPVKSEAPVAHIAQRGKAAPKRVRLEANELRSSKPSKRKLEAVEVRSASGTRPGIGEDDLIAQLERDLADVRDSCYLAQVERLIADNPDLQQLMYDMTNQKQ